MSVDADLSNYIFLPKKIHGSQEHPPLLVRKEKLSLEDAKLALYSIKPYKKFLENDLNDISTIKITANKMPIEDAVELNLYDILTQRAETYGALTDSVDPHGYLGYLNWMESHKVLQTLTTRHIMLTPRRFVDFLEMLITGEVYDGNGEKIQKEESDLILENIIGLSENPKSEYLDMYFTSQQGICVANSNHAVSDDGLMPELTEILENFCQVQGTSFDLYHWVENSNRQGLLKAVFDGKPKLNLYYNPPKVGSITVFRAVSFTTCFDCDISPHKYYAPVQGVRPVLPCN